MKLKRASITRIIHELEWIFISGTEIYLDYGDKKSFFYTTMDHVRLLKILSITPHFSIFHTTPATDPFGFRAQYTLLNYVGHNHLIRTLTSNWVDILIEFNSLDFCLNERSELNIDYHMPVLINVITNRASHGECKSCSWSILWDRLPIAAWGASTTYVGRIGC